MRRLAIIGVGALFWGVACPTRPAGPDTRSSETDDSTDDVSENSPVDASEPDDSNGDSDPGGGGDSYCCDAHCGDIFDLDLVLPGGWPVGEWVFAFGGESTPWSITVQHDGLGRTHGSSDFNVRMPAGADEQARFTLYADGLGGLRFESTRIQHQGAAFHLVDTTGVHFRAYDLYSCCCGGCMCQHRTGTALVGPGEPSAADTGWWR